MKPHFKLYSVVSLVAIFLSAWAVQSAQSASSTETGTSVESSQIAQVPEAIQVDYSSETSTGSIPSLEDRNRMLNGVNLAPPIIDNGTTSIKSVPPEPGTETGPVDLVKPIAPAPMADSSQNPAGASLNAVNIFNTSIKLISDWFTGLLNSIFNS